MATLARNASSTEETLQELSHTLEQLEAYPDNVPLLRKQISLMTLLGMASEVLNTTTRLSSLVMLDEPVWLDHLNSMISGSSRPHSLETFVDILERFERAEADYLSLAILLRHVNFILECVLSNKEEEIEVNPELKAFLEEDVVRGMLASIYGRTSGLLCDSHILWEMWMEWEQSLSRSIEQIDRIHALYLERLATPHSMLDRTSAEYSSFCSQNCPDQYEQRMIQATSASQIAKVKWNGEKRFGQTREDMEDQLVRTRSFMKYIEWETDPRARNPKHPKAPVADAELTRAVFERAVADSNRSACELPETSIEERRLYKTAEAELWDRYARWSGDDFSIRRRAARACPEIGTTWTQYLMAEENAGQDTESAFERALAMGTITTVETIAEVFVTRAGIANRAGEVQDVMSIISRGFQAVLQTQKSGDPSLQLEKFLLEWAETRHPESLNAAIEMVERPTKSRSASYQMVLLRAGIYSRHGRPEAARQLFVEAISRSDLDWPEAVYESFLRHELVHGDLITYAEAEGRIRLEKEKLTRRREKAAAESRNELSTEWWAAAAAAQSAAALPADETDLQKSELHVDHATTTAESGGSARRDREHTTVLVTDLPTNVTETEVQKFFEECGETREVTLLPNTAVVEFRTAEDVSVALTKDMKRLAGKQIHVSMLWRSTLFVTNFPPKMDDEGIRRLFSPYGTILQTRWPSRKYADSRRFCYVAMGNPIAAQEALVLDGMKVDGLDLKVAVSDPSIKTKRSDATDKNLRTLFVGGLTFQTTEHDVTTLFKDYGAVSYVKLGWDPIKRQCRGFAFVEMDTEAAAQAALALNGVKHEKRTLRVSVSDPNHANRKPNPSTAPGAKLVSDKRARTVHLYDLPVETQEGLLQQALEKIAPVTRVEVFAKTHEAVVELTSQADVGLLLLRTQPFTFNGSVITIAQQKRQVEMVNALAFAPRTARQGKAIAKPRQTTQKESTTKEGQDFFRSLVESKNEERSGKQKRKAEQVDADVTQREKRMREAEHTQPAD